MTERTEVAGLKIARQLYRLVKEEIAPGTGVQCDDAWAGFAKIVKDLGPRNRALLERRDELQASIDAWHKQHKGRRHDHAAYSPRSDTCNPKGPISPSPPRTSTPRSPRSPGRSWWCR